MSFTYNATREYKAAKECVIKENVHTCTTYLLKFFRNVEVNGKRLRA